MLDHSIARSYNNLSPCFEEIPSIFHLSPLPRNFRVSPSSVCKRASRFCFLQSSLQTNSAGAPRIVAETSSLHSNGIFGMHELGGQIATASKDKTVGITTVSEAGLEPVTVLSGHHSAAIRAVHFR